MIGTGRLGRFLRVVVPRHFFGLRNRALARPGVKLMVSRLRPVVVSISLLFKLCRSRLRNSCIFGS